MAPASARSASASAGRARANCACPCIGPPLSPGRAHPAEAGPCGPTATAARASPLDRLSPTDSTQRWMPVPRRGPKLVAARQRGQARLRTGSVSMSASRFDVLVRPGPGAASPRRRGSHCPGLVGAPVEPRWPGRRPDARARRRRGRTGRPRGPPRPPPGSRATSQLTPTSILATRVLAGGTVGGWDAHPSPPQPPAGLPGSLTVPAPIATDSTNAFELDLAPRRRSSPWHARSSASSITRWKTTGSSKTSPLSSWRQPRPNSHFS
jgi:hypothetical protein